MFSEHNTIKLESTREIYLKYLQILKKKVTHFQLIHGSKSKKKCSNYKIS